MLTITGLQFGFLLSGAVIVETVFNYPGLGWLLIQSIDARDYPVIQGLMLVFAVEFLLINMVVDLLYAAIDPRIRMTSAPPTTRRTAAHRKGVLARLLRHRSGAIGLPLRQHSSSWRSSDRRSRPSIPRSPTSPTSARALRRALARHRQFGRDTLSRVLFGARYSICIGLRRRVGALVGGLWGFWAGFSGGLLGALSMRLVDVMLAFPGSSSPSA